MRNAHPWRQLGSFKNHVVNTRSYAFRDYLAALSPEERRKIEAEEMRFVVKREDAASWQVQAARDYAKIIFAAAAV